MTDNMKNPAHSTKEAGRRGEEFAAKLLKEQGYEIVARNWRAGRTGELDIVAWEGTTLVFVEVKTATGDSFGPPENWVTPRKQRQLSRLATEYMANMEETWAGARFDVVGVWNKDGQWTATVIKDAFDAK